MRIISPTGGARAGEGDGATPQKLAGSCAPGKQPRHRQSDDASASPSTPRTASPIHSHLYTNSLRSPASPIPAPSVLSHQRSLGCGGRLGGGGTPSTSSSSATPGSGPGSYLRKSSSLSRTPVGVIRRANSAPGGIRCSLEARPEWQEVDVPKGETQVQSLPTVVSTAYFTDYDYHSGLLHITSSTHLSRRLKRQ